MCTIFFVCFKNKKNICHLLYLYLGHSFGKQIFLGQNFTYSNIREVILMETTAKQ